MHDRDDRRCSAGRVVRVDRRAVGRSDISYPPACQNACRDVGGKGGLEAVGGGGGRGTQKTPPFEMLFPCGPTRRRMPLVDSGRRVLVRRERRDGNMLGGNARGLTSPCCCLRSSRLRPKKREKSDDDSERRHEAREREVDDAHGRRGGSAGGQRRDTPSGRGEGIARVPDSLHKATVCRGSKF